MKKTRIRFKKNYLTVNEIYSIVENIVSVYNLDKEKFYVNMINAESVKIGLVAQFVLDYDFSSFSSVDEIYDFVAENNIDLYGKVFNICDIDIIINKMFSTENLVRGFIKEIDERIKSSDIDELTKKLGELKLNGGQTI